MRGGQPSARSLANLEGVEPRLAAVVLIAMKVVDCSVIWGVRSAEQQAEIYAKGRDANGEIVNPDEVVTYRDGAEKMSAHQRKPGELYGRAVDLLPHPSGWDDPEMFCVLAGAVFAAAHLLGVAKWVRWGRDWDGDGDLADQTFNDYAHFEWIGPVG